jgi:hypothetical protein
VYVVSGCVSVCGVSVYVVLKSENRFQRKVLCAHYIPNVTHNTEIRE